MERRAGLEKLLANYNEGRSKSLYCRVAALMPVDMIREAINKAEEIIESEKTS